MRCPYCKEDEDKVVDTRSNEGGREVRRRRECVSCGRRFTSFERVEEISVMVLKKDGRKELFDTQKVYRSIDLACRKRPVQQDQLQKIADRVEEKSMGAESKELSSKKIGDIIIKELKKLDPVAFIRFSSVYREYDNVDQFLKIVESLRETD